ncbi:DUF6538 domain-containing protein [Microvirga pakistanensis]|uniref:DUF6538 domain-containing protein n=1 Tax=Microvirga pakistanensis TaxID=1682650 RepID=UPI003CC7D877
MKAVTRVTAPAVRAQPEVGRSDYLQCRRGWWFIRLRVPAHLLPEIGQTHLVRSLDTRDEAVAQQRRWVALAELWRWIGSQTVLDGWSPAWAAHLTGSSGAVDPLASVNSIPLQSGPDIHSPRVRRSRSAKSFSTGHLSIATMAERWLAEIEGEHTRQTVALHRMTINQFANFHSGNTSVRSVDRKTAGEFVSRILIMSGSTQKTITRKISSLSSMWRWLAKRGFVETNPWQGQGSFSARAKRNTARKRAYRSDELCTLFRTPAEEVIGRRYGSAISDLQRLGFLTGCRLGELCDIRAEDVRFRPGDGNSA